MKCVNAGSASFQIKKELPKAVGVILNYLYIYHAHAKCILETDMFFSRITLSGLDKMNGTREALAFK